MYRLVPNLLKSVNQKKGSLTHIFLSKAVQPQPEDSTEKIGQPIGLKSFGLELCLCQALVSTHVCHHVTLKSVTNNRANSSHKLLTLWYSTKYLQTFQL